MSRERARGKEEEGDFLSTSFLTLLKILSSPRSRQAESEEFFSCLTTFNEITSPSGTSLTSLLKRAMSIQELDDTSWLSSTFINLILTQFAKSYPDVHYLPIDFAHLSLNSASFDSLTDILGRSIQYDLEKPIIFLCNKGNIHWTLFRVAFNPSPELQLFEPLGKLNRTRARANSASATVATVNHRPLSYRYVPREVISWLDHCVPLPSHNSWITLATSAITLQQQDTSFDCGVACLLYAEMCGLGRSKEQINVSTTQQDITLYRRDLQDFLKNLNQGGDFEELE